MSSDAERLRRDHQVLDDEALLDAVHVYHLPAFEVRQVDRMLCPDVNPRDAKEVLGRAVVAQYHGTEAAEGAAEAFRRRALRLDPDNRLKPIETLRGRGYRFALAKQ